MSQQLLEDSSLSSSSSISKPLAADPLAALALNRL